MPLTSQALDLIESADMNGLLRVIDSLVEVRGWDDLVDLATRCEEATERGKQLWPIAAHVDFRLALEGPGEYAGQVLDSDLQRFTLGPLTEVAASRHTWRELRPYLETPQAAAYVAQERVMRGEVLDGDPAAHPEVLELPLRIESWEPTYSLATYRSSLVEVDEPWTPKEPLREGARREAEVLDEVEISQALLDLVHAWTTESNGAASSVVVEGDAAAAVSHLSPFPFHIGALGADEALRWMAWAAASGGAYGRRRGAAIGRSMAWHVGRLLTDTGIDEPSAELGSRLRALRWYRWDERTIEEGWSLRLAVEDPDNGWAAAVGAADLIQEETDE